MHIFYYAQIVCRLLLFSWLLSCFILFISSLWQKERRERKRKGIVWFISDISITEKYENVEEDDIFLLYGEASPRFYIRTDYVHYCFLIIWFYWRFILMHLSHHCLRLSWFVIFWCYHYNCCDVLFLLFKQDLTLVLPHPSCGKSSLLFWVSLAKLALWLMIYPL